METVNAIIFHKLSFPFFLSLTGPATSVARPSRLRLRSVLVLLVAPYPSGRVVAPFGPSRPGDRINDDSEVYCCFGGVLRTEPALWAAELLAMETDEYRGRCCS